MLLRGTGAGMKLSAADHLWRWLRLEAADWLLWVKLTARTRRLYGEVLRDHPDDARTHASLAFLDASEGHKARAVSGFDRVIALTPDDTRAYYNRGFLQQDLKQHADAVESFDRVLALNPKHDLAHYGKALSLIALGKVEEAVAPLKRATELQPMSPFGWYQLARVHHGQGRTDMAEKIIRHLRTFEPKVADQLARETGIRAELAA